MRKRRIGFKRIKQGLWRERGKWTPTYAFDQQHADGVEYQHYGLDANGKLVYAGVTRHERMNQAQANQIHRVWRRWRHEYDTVFDGVGRDYPAKHHVLMPSTLVVFPIDNPNQQERFAI